MHSQPSKQGQSFDDQAQIQYLKNELRKMQSLAALGELTGTATHEFNNVLMTIINYARFGIRNRDDASRDKALAKIRIRASICPTGPRTRQLYQRLDLLIRESDTFELRY